MPKSVLHLVIACCTFGLSILLSSAWNLGTELVYPGEEIVLPSSQTNTTFELELAEIYANYASAQTTHDIAFFERVEAENFVLFTGLGAFSRLEAIAWLKSQSSQIEYKLEDVKMHSYGDAAIVTGKIKAVMPSGNIVSWGWIDVCVKRDGRWLIQSTTQTN
jgi:hypothetical protein